jgi:hypothetical protein
MYIDLALTTHGMVGKENVCNTIHFLTTQDYLTPLKSVEELNLNLKYCITLSRLKRAFQKRKERINKVPFSFFHFYFK